VLGVVQGNAGGAHQLRSGGLQALQGFGLGRTQAAQKVFGLLAQVIPVGMFGQ
jgi:hypothetical protein